MDAQYCDSKKSQLRYHTIPKSAKGKVHTTAMPGVFLPGTCKATERRTVAPENEANREAKRSYKRKVLSE